MSMSDFYQNKGKEPLFSVKVDFDSTIAIPERDIMKSEPIEFRLPPNGDSNEEDFDPLVHLELEVKRLFENNSLKDSLKKMIEIFSQTQ